MSHDDMVDQAAKVLSRAWKNIHTNESLGYQRMLAGALADAGLLARPLPTRYEISEVILAESLFGSRTPIAAADAVLALLKGQDA